MTQEEANNLDAAQPNVGAAAGRSMSSESTWGWQLIDDFRRSQSVAVAGGTWTLEHRLEKLLDLLVPTFCQWCRIDIVATNEIKVRSRDESSSGERLDVPNEASLTGGLDNPARPGHVTESTPPDEGYAGSNSVSAALRSGNRIVAEVTCANSEAGPKIDDDALMVLEHVLWLMGGLLDHDHLQRVNREAVRQSQAVARQLHQLIAASINVARSTTDQQILSSLATSVRSVFDGDVAVVSSRDGQRGRLASEIRRGGWATVATPQIGEAFELMAQNEGRWGPWTEGEWLVSPILFEPKEVGGVIAVARSAPPFSNEDREIVTLLGQMAATALSSSALNHAIATSQARQRVLLETAPVGIIEINARFRATYWNPTASRVLGWPTFQDIVVEGSPLFPETIELSLREICESAAGGGAVEPWDISNVQIGDRSRILSVVAVRMPTGTDVGASTLLLVDDVTSQRELKQESRHAQTMEMRGQIASRIAHDFNNLLTLISGYSEILVRELSLDDRLAQMAKDIQATASRASLLTGQLQTIGRIKALVPVTFDPAAVMQSNAEVLERILGSNINVKWDLADAVQYVFVDEDQFEQMILNLSINARDAMPDGGELVLSVHRRAIEDVEAAHRGIAVGEYVRIAVQDTGVGMDAETLERCFQPLFTTKGPFKGTGMGLASARRLMEESRGAISCTSTVGIGTTFEILLPEAEVPTRPVESVDQHVHVSTGERILVVDDDAGLLRLVSQVLRRNGYQVLESSSGIDAIDMLHNADGAVDVLITDVVLGGMTGRELAHVVSNRYPKTLILVMSGTADATIIDGLDPKLTAFIAKPFRPSSMIDAVHDLLHRSR